MGKVRIADMMDPAALPHSPLPLGTAHVVLVHLAACLFLCGFRQAPSLPPGPFRSTVPPEKRIAAVDRLEALLEKKATASNGFKRAAARLRTEAIVFEPLGEGSSRVLRVGKIKTKSLWGVMPLYAADAKVSAMYREFLAKKPAFGLDPDNPIVIVKVESPKLGGSLPALAKTINEAPKD
jgi:hypothetical protein